MNWHSVWLEIDLGAIAANTQRVKGLLSPGTALLAVVKADAYGHGAVPVAQTVLAAGADYLAVATGDEALELRGVGITAPILVLNAGLPGWQEEALILQGVTQTVCSRELALAIDRTARRLGKRAPVHLKVETGMGRLGVPWDAVLPVARELWSLPGIYLEAIYSHLAVADEDTDSSRSYTWEQFSRFQKALTSLAGAGLTVPLAHIANSAAILHYPPMHLDLVRAGCIVYGFYPLGSDEEKELVSLVPALSCKSIVSEIISLDGAKRLAVVPAGLIHGFPQTLKAVIVGGRRVPVVGPVGLDHCLVDISCRPTVKVGDEVVFIGRQGEEEITAAEAATWAGTITEEITCRLGKLPRVYVGGS